jgi:predicted permease
MPVSIAAQSPAFQKQLLAEAVTADYFQVLGIRPNSGRFFDAADSSSETAPVVISARLAKEILESGNPLSDAASLKINGISVAVIGVAPAGFSGAAVPWVTDVWLPAQSGSMANLGVANFSQALSSMTFIGLVRMKSGISAGQASQSLNALDLQFRKERPGIENVPLVLSQGNLVRNSPIGDSVAIMSVLLSAISILILLIACGNVATLLLARASARRIEIAIQLALGAGRGIIIRQLLTGSLLLAFLGGAAAFGVASWVSRLLILLVPTSVGGGFTVRHPFTSSALLFGVVAAVFSTLLSGLVPALGLSRVDIAETLKSARGKMPGRFGWRRLGVILQVALASLALTACGLFMRSLQAALTVDLGFNGRDLLICRLDLRGSKLDGDALQLRYESARTAVAAIPGVSKAALASSVPLGAIESATDVKLANGSAVSVGSAAVGREYFEAMGVPLLRGRGLASSTDEAVVNEAMARRLWPGQEALGKPVQIPGQRAKFVVGIAANGRYASFGESGRRPFLFTSAPDLHSDEAYLVVRTTGDPSGWVGAVRNALSSSTPGLARVSVLTLSEHLAPALSPLRSAASLLSAYGALCLLLAITGIYGIFAFSIAGQKREIAIRMALGATDNQVMWWVLRNGLRWILCGLAIGLPAAVAAGPLFSSLLVGVKPGDPVTLFGVAAVIASLGMAASLLAFARYVPDDSLATLRAE